jgi:hypothetical protein
MLGQAQGGGRGIAPTNSQLGARRKWVVSTTLGTVLLGSTQYSLYRKLGGLQGQSWTAWKISSLLGLKIPGHPVCRKLLYCSRYVGRIDCYIIIHKTQTPPSYETGCVLCTKSAYKIRVPNPYSCKQFCEHGFIM